VDSANEKAPPHPSKNDEKQLPPRMPAKYSVNSHVTIACDVHELQRTDVAMDDFEGFRVLSFPEG
jgi:hypothetical protein